MDIYLYPQLSTRSQRCMRRRVKRTGYPYEYRPRGNLLQRLATDNNLTIDQTYQQLMRERNELLRIQDMD